MIIICRPTYTPWYLKHCSSSEWFGLDISDCGGEVGPFCVIWTRAPQMIPGIQLCFRLEIVQLNSHVAQTCAIGLDLTERQKGSASSVIDHNHLQLARTNDLWKNFFATEIQGIGPVDEPKCQLWVQTSPSDLGSNFVEGVELC